VDSERNIPELYVVDRRGRLLDRIMDLVVRWPASGRCFWLDVTVRSPFAADLVRPHERPGEAARSGEADKRSHYGEAVIPFAMEPFGRLGPQALHAVAALHKESGDYGKLRPGTGRTVALHLRALRADLEATVVRAAAQQTLLALGSCAVQALGWPARRDARPALPAGTAGRLGEEA